MLKNAKYVKEIHHRQNSLAICSPHFSCFTTNASAGNFQGAFGDKSGMIINQMGKHNILEMVEVQVSPRAPTRQ
jgi:hypothetical protein